MNSEAMEEIEAMRAEIRGEFFALKEYADQAVELLLAGDLQDAIDTLGDFESTIDGIEMYLEEIEEIKGEEIENV